jgi:hypothetical protein
VETRGPAGEHRACLVPLGVCKDGKRNPRLERAGSSLFTRSEHLNGSPTADWRKSLLHEKIEPMLERELRHRGFVPSDGSYAAKLVGWIEVEA